MNAATLATRARLLERCQHERNALVAMTAGAVAHAPRAIGWLRAARTFIRLLRILSMRAAPVPERN